MDWSRVHFSISFSHVSSFLNKLIPTPNPWNLQKPGFGPKGATWLCSTMMWSGQGMHQALMSLYLKPIFRIWKNCSVCFSNFVDTPILWQLRRWHFDPAFQDHLGFHLGLSRGWGQNIPGDAKCESLPGSIVDARGHPQITIPHRDGKTTTDPKQTKHVLRPDRIFLRSSWKKTGQSSLLLLSVSTLSDNTYHLPD